MTFRFVCSLTTHNAIHHSIKDFVWKMNELRNLYGFQLTIIPLIRVDERLGSGFRKAINVLILSK